jgi:hypothetical protein
MIFLNFHCSKEKPRQTRFGLFRAYKINSRGHCLNQIMSIFVSFSPTHAGCIARTKINEMHFHSWFPTPRFIISFNAVAGL